MYNILYIRVLRFHRLTIVNGRAFLNGSWSYDVCHQLSQPLRIKEVDVLQSMILKVKQCACIREDTEEREREREGGRHTHICRYVDRYM